MSIAKSKLQKKQFSLNDLVIESILDKKGEEVVLMDLTTVNDTIVDTFIICDADNTTQVRAIANHILERTEEAGMAAYSKEGFANSEWILIDFMDTVVHVFLKTKRQLYQLEELWHDAAIQKIGE